MRISCLDSICKSFSGFWEESCVPRLRSAKTALSDFGSWLKRVPASLWNRVSAGLKGLCGSAQDGAERVVEVARREGIVLPEAVPIADEWLRTLRQNVELTWLLTLRKGEEVGENSPSKEQILSAIGTFAKRGQVQLGYTVSSLLCHPAVHRAFKERGITQADLTELLEELCSHFWPEEVALSEENNQEWRELSNTLQQLEESGQGQSQVATEIKIRMNGLAQSDRSAVATARASLLFALLQLRRGHPDFARSPEGRNFFVRWWNRGIAQGVHVALMANFFCDRWCDEFTPEEVRSALQQERNLRVEIFLKILLEEDLDLIEENGWFGYFLRNCPIACNRCICNAGGWTAFWGAKRVAGASALLRRVAEQYPAQLFGIAGDWFSQEEEQQALDFLEYCFSRSAIAEEQVVCSRALMQRVERKNFLYGLFFLHCTARKPAIRLQRGSVQNVLGKSNEILTRSLVKSWLFTAAEGASWVQEFLLETSLVHQQLLLLLAHGEESFNELVGLMQNERVCTLLEMCGMNADVQLCLIVEHAFEWEDFSHLSAGWLGALLSCTEGKKLLERMAEKSWNVLLLQITGESCSEEQALKMISLCHRHAPSERAFWTLMGRCPHRRAYQRMVKSSRDSLALRNE